MSISSRRSFLTTAAGLVGTAMLPAVTNAQATAADEWDLSWLDKLNGKHRQVFDLSSPDDLRVVANWLNAHRDVFGMDFSQLNAVVGIAGKAFPANASDELYQRFPIGEEWKVKDPETDKPALRNIFLTGGKTPKDQEATVHGLQARGVIFWQCNNALKGIARDLAEKVNRPKDEVYAELKAGLNPGVILVPAHTMLIGLVQERGCTYEKV